MIKKNRLALLVATLAFSQIQLAFAERVQHPPLYNPGTATTPEEAQIRLLKSLKSKGITQLPLAEPRIVIEKSKRQLSLYNGETLIKTFHVDLGRKPNGPKESQGDYRTPEGTFHIVKRSDVSNFHLFLGLNYPNSSSADQALNQRKISKALRDQIVVSEQKKTIPPWNTKLGGAVGIHGVGKGQSLVRKFGKDWTAGCIALTDREIEEIWVATNQWTPVEIKQ